VFIAPAAINYGDLASTNISAASHIDRVCGSIDCDPSQSVTWLTHGYDGRAHGSFGGFEFTATAASAAVPSKSTPTAAMRKRDTAGLIVLLN
jgi:hypothetical protein